MNPEGPDKKEVAEGDLDESIKSLEDRIKGLVEMRDAAVGENEENEMLIKDIEEGEPFPGREEKLKILLAGREAYSSLIQTLNQSILSFEQLLNNAKSSREERLRLLRDFEGSVN